MTDLHSRNPLYLSDFIAQLQLIQVQHGDIQVWIENGMIGGPYLKVEELLLAKQDDPVKKVLQIS